MRKPPKSKPVGENYDGAAEMLNRLHIIEDAAEANPDPRPLGQPIRSPLGRWPRETVAAPGRYTFCERSTATTLSPEHIRLAGAPDTTSCGGRDLTRDVDETTVRTPLDRRPDTNPLRAQCGDVHLSAHH